VQTLWRKNSLCAFDEQHGEQGSFVRGELEYHLSKVMLRGGKYSCPTRLLSRKGFKHSLLLSSSCISFLGG
jgi:hypothetical protein